MESNKLLFYVTSEITSNLPVKIKFYLKYLSKEITSYNFYEIYPKISFGNLSGLKSVPQKDMYL